jgi:hypothetical protein
MLLGYMIASCDRGARRPLAAALRGQPFIVGNWIFKIIESVHKKEFFFFAVLFTHLFLQQAATSRG